MRFHGIFVLLLLTASAFSLGSSGATYLETSFSISGSVTNGYLILHVPQSYGIQRVYQTSNYTISSDSLGDFVNVSGKFNYSARIVVNTSLLKIVEDSPFPLQSLMEYAEPSAFIDSNSSAISQRAFTIVSPDSGELQAVASVVQWVYNSMHYDMSSAELPRRNASSIYADRSGVCGDYSVLSIAFLRSLGIPSRYVAGYLLQDEGYQPHAWLEVFIPGTGWYPVDPTNGQFMVTADHVSLYSSMDPEDLKDTLFYTGTQADYRKDKPSFGIIESRDFSGLFETYASLSSNVVNFGSALEETVTVKSKVDYYLVPSFILSTSGFEPSGSVRVLVISPFGEATAVYSLLAPEEPSSDKSYLHFLSLTGPGVNILSNVTVRSEGNYYPSGTILIRSMKSAHENGSVIIDVVLQNMGNSASSAKAIVSSQLSGSLEQSAEIDAGGEASLAFIFPVPGNAAVYIYNVTVIQGESSFSRALPVVVRSQANYAPETDVGKVFITCLAIIVLLIIALAFYSFWKSKKEQRLKYKKHSEARTIKHSMDFLINSEENQGKVFEARKRRK